jgi:Arc/MetJ-type ribon-helix-helix transcriptional regulator
MVIVTANVSSRDLEMADNLVGQTGLYTSRSELIRYALREFLLEKLEMLKKSEHPQYVHMPKEQQNHQSAQKHYIRIPIEKTSEKSNPKQNFKIYKVIKKLET